MVAIPQSRVQLDNAALLALKLIGFGLMVGDHLDTMVFGGSLGIHASIGRIVFPLFALVLGLNLARSDDWSSLLRRTAPRLAAIGVVASPIYAMLMGFSHFNVMFTLAAGVVAVAFLQRSWYLAAAATVFAAGLSVDYGAWGILAIVGAWMATRGGLPLVVAACFVSLAVVPVNGSLWSLLAIPLVAAASQVQGDAPRFSWLFWAGYPAHLVVIALIASGAL